MEAPVHLWEVWLTKKAEKMTAKMPPDEQAALLWLIGDLATKGPVRGDWPNYSKLGGDLHHCHLSPKWVACWEMKNKQLKLIEVYYAGSRKNAPYR